MPKDQAVGVFIDGSNFYFKLKDKEIGMKDLSKFDFRGLAKWLALNRKVNYCGYYIGVVKAKADNKKAQFLRRNQQKLFSHLSNKKQSIEIKRGFMMESDGKFHEKGVDVHLATDLLIGAYENLWDTAIIISSDTDLIPAIKKVMQLGKKIEYIGFSHKPSYGLQKCATLTRLLIKEEVKPFEYRVNK
ncbi:MAG: NYN domain-containing protein [bacterium]